MSKGLRNTLLIAAVMIVIGGILSVVGFVLGGMKPVTLTGDGLYVFDNKAEDYTLVEEEYEELRSVVIDVDAVDIKFEEGSSFGLKGNYYPNLVELNFSETNKTLTINSSAAENLGLFGVNGFNFGFGVYHGIENELIVTYPKGTIFETVNIKSDIAKVSADGIYSKSLVVDMNTGALNATNIQVDSASIDMNLGACNISNLTIRDSAEFVLNSGALTLQNAEINNIKAALNLGDFDLDGELKGKADMSLQTGSLNLTLLNTEDSLSYYAETNLGSISIGGQSLGSHAKQSANSPSCDLTAKCNLGSINIDVEQ